MSNDIRIVDNNNIILDHRQCYLHFQFPSVAKLTTYTKEHNSIIVVVFYFVSVCDVQLFPRESIFKPIDHIQFIKHLKMIKQIDST